MLAVLGVIVTVPLLLFTESVSALPLLIAFTLPVAEIVTSPVAAFVVNVTLLPAVKVSLRSCGVKSVFVPPLLIVNVLRLALSIAFNCFTLTASRSLVPPATLIIRRVILLPPDVLPTDTTPLPLLLTASPVKYDVPLTPSASTALDPSPNTTE